MPKAAIIGCDETAAGWAARLVLHGWEVAVVDAHPQAPARLEAVLARARRWLPTLSEAALPPEGRVEFVSCVRSAVEGAGFIHISCNDGEVVLPPGLPATHADPAAGLGLAGSDPIWLLPLARLVSDGKTTPETIDRISEILTSLGMAPVLETPGHPPRAGWDPARPALTPEAVAALGLGLLAATGGLEGEARDAALAGLLRSLKERDLGTGRILAAHDARLRTAAPLAASDPVRLQVLPAWIDYNGHMTESRYLYACSETTDAFLRRIGAGLDYVATGYSYYSAETHIRHMGESKLGDRLTGSVQVLAVDAKRLHLFVTLTRGEQVVATLEQMLLHVDMRANRACSAHAAVLARLLPIAEAHKALPPPEGAGRRVGERRAPG